MKTPALIMANPLPEGGGTAITMDIIEPSLDRMFGGMRLTFYKQPMKEVAKDGESEGESVNARPPDFDWNCPFPIELGFFEITNLVYVLEGNCPSLEEVGGIRLQLEGGEVALSVKHVVSPRSGYEFSYKATPKAEEKKEDEAQSPAGVECSILIPPAQANGIACLLRSAMARMVFGR